MSEIANNATKNATSSSTSTPTVVVTGAAGLIGSRLVQALLKNTPPESIIAVDFWELYKNRDCTKSFRDLPLSFREPRQFLVDWSAGKVRPSAVYHMGASSSTEETRLDYLNEVNMGYSCRIWELSSAYTIPLVYASSAATYGNGDLGFSDEPAQLQLLRPLNPYGWSKHRFDLYVQNSDAQHRSPPRWVGLKFFNVYGPGETHKGSQASTVLHARQQIIDSGAVKLFKSAKPGIKDGEQKRDFVYVDDCVDVCLSAVRGEILNGLYNVGTGSARTFVDLATATAAALKKPLKIDWIDTPEKLQSHYQYFTQADLTRLRKAGYSAPFRTLEDGVQAYMQSFSPGSKETTA